MATNPKTEPEVNASPATAAAQELGVKAGQMFQPIRVAVTGRKNSPPLFETLEVLGRDKTLPRIDQAIASVQQPSRTA
jgi:glutamyl-tRNA synthetase